MRNEWQKLLLMGATLAWAGAPTPQQADGTLERVRSLALDSLAGSVPTFYSSGFQERAKSLQAMFQEAGHFLHDAFRRDA